MSTIDTFIRDREHLQEAITELHRLSTHVDNYGHVMSINGLKVSTTYYSPSQSVRRLICSEIDTVIKKKQAELDALESRFQLKG